ncbi:MAG: hypothetical protein ACYC3X_25475 [Pirellulaceae bacterium]
MTIEFGQHIQITTPNGPLSGRVVGTEDRDPSRHGNGQAQLFVCVAMADSNEWRWFSTNEVQR